MTTVVASFIIKSKVLKFFFGYAFTISSLSLIEQEVSNQEFFTTILNKMPSKVAIALGIVYGVTIVLKKVSGLWHYHQTNRLNLKKQKEELEQEEINTNIKRKKL